MRIAVGDFKLVDDRKLVIGALTAYPSNALARLNSDGTLDTTFAQIDVDSEIRAISIAADGSIIIGGTFISIDGELGQAVARISSEGFRTAFNPLISVEGLALVSVDAITIARDDSIVVAGQLSDGSICVARLDSEGSVISSAHVDIEFVGSDRLRICRIADADDPKA